MVDTLISITFNALSDKYSIQGSQEWIIELDSSTRGTAFLTCYFNTFPTILFLLLSFLLSFISFTLTCYWFILLCSSFLLKLFCPGIFFFFFVEGYIFYPLQTIIASLNMLVCRHFYKLISTKSKRLNNQKGTCTLVQVSITITP